MSKKKQDPAAETADETTAVDTPEQEALATETPESSDFTCPNCKHTACVNLGTPYKQGEQTLQLVKCEKCNHVMNVPLA